jgi:CBS domain-containing protein
MLLDDILKAKGGTVFAIHPGATLKDVVDRLVEHHIGSLVICEAGSIERGVLGIVTERDILRACASGHKPLDATRADEAMSTDLVTGTPDSTVEDTMGLMTERRIRHLPVLCEGKLVGMVSIGDVVKAQHDHLAMENHFMKDYIRS